MFPDPLTVYFDEAKTSAASMNRIGVGASPTTSVYSFTDKSAEVRISQTSSKTRRRISVRMDPKNFVKPSTIGTGTVAATASFIFTIDVDVTDATASSHYEDSINVVTNLVRDNTSMARLLNGEL